MESTKRFKAALVSAVDLTKASVEASCFLNVMKAFSKKHI